jgi:hypothetical protein
MVPNVEVRTILLTKILYLYIRYLLRNDGGADDRGLCNVLQQLGVRHRVPERASVCGGAPQVFHLGLPMPRASCCGFVLSLLLLRSR